MSLQAITEFASSTWAVRPEVLHGMAERCRSGAMLSPMARPAGRAAAAARSVGQRGGLIAVLPLYGLLMQRPGGLLSMFGGTSTIVFMSALQQALADESIQGILIDIDSPGGEVYGAVEAADAVCRARAVKPVFAMANSVAASAAYWIGANASEFFVTPGGEVGSIGVYVEHSDWSHANEADGVSTTLISAGKYKTEGNRLEPLGNAARAFIQGRVNDYYGMFTRSVARGRGVGVHTVRGGMGQGRMLGAEAALAARMVDGIATFDEVVKRLVRAGAGSAPAKAQAVIGRFTLAHAPRLAHAKRLLDLYEDGGA